MIQNTYQELLTSLHKCYPHMLRNFPSAAPQASLTKQNKTKQKIPKEQNKIFVIPYRIQGRSHINLIYIYKLKYNGCYTLVQQICTCMHTKCKSVINFTYKSEDKCIHVSTNHLPKLRLVIQMTYANALDVGVEDCQVATEPE